MLSVSQRYRSQWVLLLISSKSSHTVSFVLTGASLFKQVLGAGGLQRNLVLGSPKVLKAAIANQEALLLAPEKGCSTSIVVCYLIVWISYPHRNF